LSERVVRSWPVLLLSRLGIDPGGAEISRFARLVTGTGILHAVTSMLGLAPAGSCWRGCWGPTVSALAPVRGALGAARPATAIAISRPTPRAKLLTTQKNRPGASPLDLKG
jgi:hypothetical protein